MEEENKTEEIIRKIAQTQCKQCKDYFWGDEIISNNICIFCIALEAAEFLQHDYQNLFDKAINELK